MGVIDKGHTFVSGENVTADKLNNLADDATFNSNSTDGTTLEVANPGGYIKVKDGGIDTQHLADSAVTTDKIADGSITATKIASGAALVSGDNISELNNDSGYTTNAGTVTQVNSGTGLTGGPITSTGTIELDTGGVGTAQLADGSVTSAKISSTDSVFKINSSDQVRIGGDLNNTALESASQFGITSSTHSVLTVESTGTTDPNDDATMVLIGAGNATLQFNDTSEAPNSTGVWNTGSINGTFEIGSLGISPGVNLNGIQLVRKTLSGTDFIVPSFGNLPTFSTNTAATSGGLAVNDVYKTSTGELRIVV